MRKSLYSAFGTVKQYEEDGVTLDLGVEVKDPPCWRREQALRHHPDRQAAPAPPRPGRRRAVRRIRDIMLETYFETVVIDWENHRPRWATSRRTTCRTQEVMTRSAGPVVVDHARNPTASATFRPKKLLRTE